MFKHQADVLNLHASKVTVKILQAWMQHYVYRGLPDVKTGFRKGRGTRDQIAKIHWIIEKAREVKKKYLLLFHWLYLILCVGDNKLENSKRDGNIRPPYLSPEDTCLQVQKQLLEPDMEQWTGSKLGKENNKPGYYHLLI